MFACGAALAVWLVWSTGPERVAAALRGAAVYLPLVAALELAIIATDALATRVLLGDRARDVTRATWIRSTALAYATCCVAPASRAAGEAARAASLASDVGLPHAAAACSRVQVAALAGTAMASFACGVASIAANGPLAAMLGANAMLCVLLAAAVFSAAGSNRLTRWLRARFVPKGVPATAASPAAVARASLLCGVGRVFQTAQYAVVLFAVGGGLSARTALVAQGIHIVGATVGDAVPNQMGATESAYGL
ncbi:MAG TPA: hypothetical protein VIF62_35975, partial [Labilithrix sp.]